MKKQYIPIILVVALIACEKDARYPSSQYACRNTLMENTDNHPKSALLETLIIEIAGSGIPGIMLTLHDNDGYWSGAAGYSDLASGIPLYPCNITRVGSTVKTFTAVTILMLQEEGKLHIDDPVSQYLTGRETDGLENADKSTLRQLLQHSSGIFNYIQSLKFQTASLNDLDKTWQPDELLEYARGKEPYFSPGTDVLYSNTNYILLGMIIEKVTGKPYYQVFKEKLFDPLGMVFTQCAATDPVPADIIRGYVDFYSNMNLINATFYSGWDYFTADGGLISNAYDLNIFMTALFSGQVLSASSVEEFLKWQTPKSDYGDGFETHYGLGIFKIITRYGEAYIHSGDAIGYAASMVYFPEQQVTITWAVNGNYGKLDEIVQSLEGMEKIFGAALGG
jgi:D-alanyl-D-alanine carboxypeptidase